MRQVIEINDIQALASYRDVWHRLLAETRGASFFQTLEWLEVYWKHYGQGQKLRVLIVEESGAPIGIVPLTVAREQSRLGQLRVLTYPFRDWGSFYGPIGRDLAAILPAALQHVAHSRRDWELLDLRYMAAEIAEEIHLASMLESAGLASRQWQWKEAAIVDLTIGWEAYWASRESKVRNNLRRHEKRLNQLGEVTHVRHRPQSLAQGDGDPRWDLFDQCVAIAAISWQGMSANGTTLSHPSVRAYFRDAHAAAAQVGCIDMNLLLVSGQPVGFGYNYLYHGALEGLRIGYDPQYAKAGVGNMLYLRMFQDSFARGDRQFDMGVGSLEIKRFWWTHTAQSYRYTHYPLGSPRAQLLWLKHWLFGSHVRTEVPLSESELATAT